ncbi:MAG TPA: hypothetical protein VG826_23635 [Pirellulales bacterium]|nr:hypothetical protein [Pirellulales bacterium]
MTTGEKEPRRLRRVAVVLLLAALAAVCPFLSAVVLASTGAKGSPSDWMNAGSITALFLAPLVALRTGRLRDFLIGPTVGLLAGFLDWRAMLWLYSTARWSVTVASNVPVWGGVLGLWIASGRRSWLGRGVVLSAIVAADLAMRVAWRVFWPKVWDHDFGSFELWERQWLIEAVVYSPAAVFSVLLASRSTISRPSSV